MSQPERLTDWLGLDPENLDEIARHRNNVEQDRYDARLFGDLAKASGKLGALEQRQPETWPSLLRDLWASFYKASPELVPEGRVNPAHRVNRPVVQRILDDAETEQTRLTTMLDETASALAAAAAGERLLHEIEQRPELREPMRHAKEAAEATDDGQAEAAAAAAEAALQREAASVRRAVRAAIQTGRDEAEKLQAALAGWGLEPGDLSRVPMERRFDLVGRLMNPKMRRLAEQVGRMRNLARSRQKQRIQHERDEIHSITLGSDLAHVLPAELAMIRHPLRRLDFYRRFTEGQLLQYELTARKAQGHGPMVALIDCSGSMQGDPLDWAIAVALALVDTAARQKRRAAVLFFDTRVIKEIQFNPGERDTDKVLQVAETGVAGGTDYLPALARAVEIIGDGARFRQADVLMVTDGLCQVAEAFLATLKAEKQRLGIRIWSVLIGSDPYGELSK
ncbi:MAG: VWA domain-containing protein, partial [Chloroflexota bacterium]|nr:VWA domain-containing protein [Chloroflexota bacterium]